MLTPKKGPIRDKITAVGLFIIFVILVLFIPISGAQKDLVIEDDFSVDQGWAYTTSSDLFFDSTENNVHFHTDRGYIQKMYHVIDPLEGDFELSVDVNLEKTNANGFIYIGLTDDINNIDWYWEGVGLIIGKYAGSYFAQIGAKYDDGTQYFGMSDDKNMDIDAGKWYTYKIIKKGRNWKLERYDTNNVLLETQTGEFTGSFSPFNYILFGNGDTNQWETADGKIDNLALSCAVSENKTAEDYSDQHPPILYDASVTPECGQENSDQFEFSVVYKDEDGDPPVETNIAIRGWSLEGTSPVYTSDYNEMKKISGDVAEGAVYSYSTTLPEEGEYHYIIYFVNSKGARVDLKPNGFSDDLGLYGPTVGSECESETAENHPPTLVKLEPLSETIKIKTNESIRFKVKAQDEDAEEENDLKEVRWYLDDAVVEIDPIEGTCAEVKFEQKFDESGAYYVEAVVADEKHKKSSIFWDLIVEQRAADAPSDSGSVIYIKGEPVAHITAAVVENMLSINIYPQDGWGIPNRASLVEMMGLELKPVPVGEIILGYDEDISVFYEDISILYVYKYCGYHMVSKEEVSELPTYVSSLICDVMCLGHIWLPVGTVSSLLWTDFTDLSTTPSNDCFTDNNKYDTCIIIWPDQSVHFSGDAFDKAYVDSPNYVSLKIRVSIDKSSEIESKYIYIYVKTLLTKLHDYGGLIVGDYGSSTYANCEVLKVPIT